MLKRTSVMMAVILMAVLILGSFSFPVQAATVVSSGKCGANLTWTLDADGVLAVSGTGNMTQYTYQTQVPWYNQRAAIKTVVIERGVTGIAPYSFFDCPNLARVSISSTVLSIGDSAFVSCTSLTELTLGSGVRTVGVSAFYDCSALETVTIPSSVTAIGYGAFSNCISLQEVYIPSVANWCSISFTGNLSNPLYYADHLYINGKLTTDVVIPSGVTKIPSFAFYGWNGITSIAIPNSVVEIGTSAFYMCDNLSSAQLGSGLQKIGAYAFKACGSLTQIAIPASISSIGAEAFLNSGLEEASYGGTKAQWDAISVGTGNAELVDLLWSMELFNIAGANVKMGDSLTMYFYVANSNVPGEDYYAVITKTYADGRADVVKTVDYSEWEAYGSSMKRFSFEGIAAKEMCDDLYVTVYSGDGTQVSNEWIDNVRTYAHRGLSGTSNAELKTALVDMLNYGAMAQNMFKYNTADLANSQLTAEQAALATDTVTYENKQVKGDKFAGGSLVLESQLILTMYYSGIDTSMYAVVSYTDSYGDPVEVTVPGSEFTSRGSLLGVSVTGLNIADGRQLVTCTIYDSNGNQVGSGADSVESVVARAIAAGNDEYLYIIKFVESAYQYLH